MTCMQGTQRVLSGNQQSVQGIVRICQSGRRAALPHVVFHQPCTIQTCSQFNTVLCNGRTTRQHAVVAKSLQSSTADVVSLPQPNRLELQVTFDQRIVLETGQIGRQANGAIMATCGDTVIYTTACASDTPSADGSFIPLSVSYTERHSASGRTSGGFNKRDGRPRDADVLISRLVDRPLRPMFTKGWANETQVLQWLMSYDDNTLPEPLAITAASAALLVSDIAFEKAVAGVRVGWINGQPVINPTAQQMKESQLDLVLAGTRDAVLMIEGYCQLLNDEQMMQAVEAGSKVVSHMCVEIEQWAAKVGKPKKLDSLVLLPQGLEEQVHALVADSLQAVYSKASTKEERSAVESAASKLVKEKIVQEGIATDMQAQVAFKNVSSEVMRRVVIDKGRRVDGRGLSEIRPITCQAGLLPRTHGSCLFTRGETQAIAVVTLGGKDDAQKSDTMRGADASEDTFYLHYFFPPSSVGEVGRVGGPGRRELGHGELAQRALAPVIPSQDTFPYTVRVESTITESNGSSSMATVCGGCLAMLDAGVPLLRPVAGVAMGLILDKKTGKHVVLSDILGTEDALGDMDFKVAGDDQGGLTAFQMDIKVEGITLTIMAEALAAAKAGREHVLQQMAKCQPPPRNAMAEFAPRVLRFQIAPQKKVVVIGTGGRTVRQICELSGCHNISVSDDGTMEIAAPTAAAANRALDMIHLLTEPVEAGRIFRNVRVNSIQAFGVFVEVSPAVGGLVHVSELDLSLSGDVANRWKVGDTMDVMVLEATAGNKLALSRRAVLLADQGQPYTTPGVQAAPPKKASSPEDGSSKTGGVKSGRGPSAAKKQRV